MGIMTKFVRAALAGVLAFGLAPSFAFADEAELATAGAEPAAVSEEAAGEVAELGEPAVASTAAEAVPEGTVTVAAPDGSGAQDDMQAEDGALAPSASAAPSAAEARAIEAASEASAREDAYYTDGDWGYYVLGEGGSHPHTVQVVDYFGSSADIVVPEEFGGFPVTEITFLLAERDLSFVRSISLPSSLKEICNFAFEGMTGLESVTLPANSQLESVGTNAFYGAKLRSFVMPAGLKTVSDGAFFGCSSLESIQFNDVVEPFVMHNSVMSGTDLFEYDSAYSIAPGATAVEYLVPATSQNFKAVDGVLYSKDGGILYACPAESAGASFTVPSTVREIAEYAFYGLEGMRELVLPEGLTTIHEYAFSESGITSFVMPDSVTTVYGYICQRCPNLERVVIGDGVKELGTCAGWQDFYFCPNLCEVDLGSSVEVIGNACFGNTALTSVDLPESVRQLNYGAFGNNYDLVEVTGGEGLEWIGRWAFCVSGLTSFPFGDKLTYVSGEAFDGSPYFDGVYPGYLQQDGAGDYRAVDASVIPEGTELYDYAYQVLDLVNQERRAVGLGELTMDRELLDAAMQRAAECAVFYSHTRPDGTDCFTVSDKAYAENIAAGQWSPVVVMGSWMQSPGHKANILTESRQSIGVGCFEADGAYYWVQLFGDAAADAVSNPGDQASWRTVNVDQSECGIEFQLELRAASGITSYAGWMKLDPGAQATLGVRALNPEFGSTMVRPESFAWTTSQPGAVSVGADGRLSRAGVGTSWVTASCGTVQLRTLAYATDPAGPLYGDVSGHWGEGWIAEAGRLELMGGVGDGLFGADETLTRAQVATTLYRYAVEDPSDSIEQSKFPADTTGFDDVEDHMWYSAALNWAKEEGIMTGYDNLVRPGDTITRAELAAMIGRFAESRGADIDGADRAAFDSTTDAWQLPEIAGYSEPYFIWACDEGILTGVANGDGTLSLRPQDTATRAQMAKIIVQTVQALDSVG